MSWITLWVVGGCAEPPAEVPDELDAESTVRILSRASLDLRGVRPTPDELAGATSGQRPLPSLIEDYLYDERFEARVLELFADTYRTRTDAFLVDPVSFGLGERQQARLQQDVGSEPLRLVARVAADDLPIHEIVTAEWSMANHVTSEVLEVDYTSEDRDWQPVHYLDGRPPAGVLSTTGMWWRYTSSSNNANRARANAISRILLCDDYLTREIDFDRTEGLLDDDFEERTQSDPSCAGCHVTLDPLASYLYGFSYYAFGGEDVARYHPEREAQWIDRTGLAPSYYGESGQTLADLGAQIANDPRYTACMIEQITTAMVGEPVTDPAEQVEHTLALAQGGWTLRSLMRSVADSTSYRAASDADSPHAHPAKLASPALLGTSVEALTGFVWEEDGTELLTSDLLGYLSLAGGADGYTTTERATVPNATILLVQERLAEAAAEAAVRQAVAEPGSVPLIDGVELDWRPASDAGAMSEVLSAAQLRALGREASDEELADLLALWDELLELEGGDAEAAWAGVLSVLLRDPDFVLY